MSLLLALSAGLIHFNTPLLERQKILAPYFSPAPGESLEVTARARALTRGGDMLLTKGELWIKPPVNTCLIIRSDLKRRDQKFCRASPYIWDLFDLDGAGRLTLTVIAGPKDEGTSLTWTTPYRIANVVPIEPKEEGENFNIPVMSCDASVDQETRKIKLTLMDGRKWFIYLPDFDKPVSDNAPPPNLIVRIDQKKLPTPPDPKGQVAPDDAPKGPSALGALLAGGYKEIVQAPYTFRVSKRNSYEMSSSHFMETNVPQGMSDLCRYMFEGAPGDPGSGVIECYNTDSLAAVYTHVTCFSQFAPRLAPPPAKQPAQRRGE